MRRSAAYAQECCKLRLDNWTDIFKRKKIDLVLGGKMDKHEYGKGKDMYHCRRSHHTMYLLMTL